MLLRCALPAVSALYLNSMRVSERSEALIRDNRVQSSGFSERFMATISAWVMSEPVGGKDRCMGIELC
jgi:hypothetical protein